MDLDGVQSFKFIQTYVQSIQPMFIDFEWYDFSSLVPSSSQNSSYIEAM